MTGNEWLDWLIQTLDKPSPARDAYILQAAQDGLLKVNWTPIISTIVNHTATFYVCEDAAYIELDDGSRFRPQCSAYLNQKLADVFNASMITAKLMDLRHQQAVVKINAQTLPSGSQMVLMSYSKKWNEFVEKQRAGRETLLSDCGKCWCLDNLLSIAPLGVNYGFYSSAAPYTNPQGIKMWQTLGTKHGLVQPGTHLGAGFTCQNGHTDESQTVFLIKSNCEIDGQSSTIADIATDPVLSYLLNYSGILKFIRQPYS